MPVEFPIVIAEHLDTYTHRIGIRFGWKLSYVSFRNFQLTLHRMDTRPGWNRLISQPEAMVNIPLVKLYHDPVTLVRGRDVFHEGGATAYSTIVTTERLTEAIMLAREAIATGWLPEDEDAFGPEPFEMCDIDELPIALHNASQTHDHCMACEETLPTTFLQQWAIRGNRNTYTASLCHACRDHGASLNEYIYVQDCVHCGGLTDDLGHDIIDYFEDMDVPVCHSCLDELDFCEEGEHYVGRYTVNDDDACEDCYRSANSPAQFIRSWNYRPNLEFHPEVPTNPLHPLYIGIELEMSWPYFGTTRREEAFEWLQTLNEDHGSLLFAKSDSSVNDGFEVVSHPMEPQWALEYFPFDFFQEAIENGALETHQSAGTHIHVDKASLTTAQLWKILQVHKKMDVLCGTIGGRGTSSQWADWRNMGRINEQMMRIAREKGRAFGDVERYVPVNVRNEQTIELRYMAGSINPDMIKKNIEWVQALYDFTNYISVQDIKDGVLDNQSYLVGWILNGEYPSLANYLSNNIIIPASMPERVS